MERENRKDRETIIYGGKKYHRYPLSKRRQLRVYFWRHDKWKEPPVALHRQIWIDTHGEIPKGYFVHHIDGNPLNNEIGNLTCMLPGEHTKKHMEDPHQKHIMREAGKRQTARIVKALADWKQSPEGKRAMSEHGKKYAERAKQALAEWRKTDAAKLVNSENGKKQAPRLVAALAEWKKRPEARQVYSDAARKSLLIDPCELSCAVCGSAFMAVVRHAKYCSPKCKGRAGNRKKAAKKKGL